MDGKDLMILSAVSELRTGSPEEIAGATSIPKSTVHYRLDNLKEEGIIENDLLDLDISKIGINITVISEVMAEYEEGYHDHVGQKLSEVEGVSQVHFTMGDTDFIVISHLAGRDMVERLIRDFESIEEIERTSSKFVIKSIKDNAHSIEGYELETLTDRLLPDEA